MSEIVRYHAGVPVAFRASVQASLVDPVVHVVGEVIQSLAIEGIRVSRAVVVSYRSAQAEVEFHTAELAVYRREVLPIVAKAKAHKRGIDQLNRMNLDPDLLDMAVEHLQRNWN